MNLTLTHAVNGNDMAAPAAPELDVCTLDVWGNDNDGFEVNGEYRSGITVLGGMDDDYYYRQIRNYFPHLPPFGIEWDDENYARVDSRRGKPLLTIRAK